MPRDERLFLYEIRDAIAHIQVFTAGGKDDFLRSTQLQQAVYWNLAVIGEAAGRLSDDVKAQAASVPWQDVIAMRNLLIHEYFGVDLEVVWKTIEDDLPGLSAAVDALIAE